MLSQRAGIAAICLTSTLLAGPLQAKAGDATTIGEVAAMEPRERIKYVHNEASRRGLEIGIAHGDEVLRCLSNEFVGIEARGDGTHIIPRGLKAAIRIIHLENNNGGQAQAAAARIDNFVDYVAARVCGVKPDSSSH